MIHLPKFDSHVAEAAKADNAQPHAWLVYAIVLHGGIDCDPCAQQRGSRIHWQALWYLQRIPARVEELQTQWQRMMGGEVILVHCMPSASSKLYGAHGTATNGVLA